MEKGTTSFKISVRDRGVMVEGIQELGNLALKLAGGDPLPAAVLLNMAWGSMIGWDWMSRLQTAAARAEESSDASSR